MSEHTALNCQVATAITCKVKIKIKQAPKETVNVFRTFVFHTTTTAAAATTTTTTKQQQQQE